MDVSNTRARLTLIGAKWAVSGETTRACTHGCPVIHICFAVDPVELESGHNASMTNQRLTGPAISPLTREALLAQGTPERSIRTRVDSGAWLRVIPGGYVPREQLSAASEVDRHLALIRLLGPTMSAGSVMSHTSAAALWGLPLWNVDLTRVHCTREQKSGSCVTRNVHLHGARSALTPAERPVDATRSVAVTSAARTVVDCARMVGFEQGVILADAALHKKLATREELQAEVLQAGNCKGVSRARKVVEFADGRSESPGESRSRIVLCNSSLPGLELQYNIITEQGRWIARTDFAIPELKVAGEFDGQVKYGRYVPSGKTAGDVVFDEKVREDAIRDEQWEVVRWIWQEIATPQVILSRFHRAVERALARRR